MNRYDEDDEKLVAPDSNPHLSTNIMQLRKEKRLTQEEFSEKLGVMVEEVKAWEKGEIVPSKKEIEKMITILKISYYDMMTRDILTERNQITIKMKKSKDRSNYDWYYGSKKKIILDLVYLTGIPLVFFLAFVIFKNAGYYVGTEFVQSNILRFALAYISCSIISGIIVTINIAIKFKYQFQWWHLFWISTLSWIVVLIGIISTIPYYIYTIVNLIMKRGKNHR